MGMGNRIKRWVKRNPNRKRKVLCRQNGHTFYAIGDISAVVAVRYLAFLRLLEVHQLGVSDVDLKAFFKLINDAVAQQQWGNIPKYITTMEAYLDLYTDHSRVFEVANCFVLVDDEPADRFSEEHTVIKHQMYNSSDRVRFFFITYVQESLKNMDVSAQSMQLVDYLKGEQVQLVEKAFSKLITSNTLGKSKQA
jgi:hypothetical protein